MKRVEPLPSSLCIKAAGRSRVCNGVQGAPAPPPPPDSVRVSTVDNYQGEEADIVVVSLVRSAPASGRIGFLDQPQRVNVLLSRAKLGLILLGNSDTLLAGSARRKTWETALKHIPIAPGLQVKCEKHGTVAELCTADDFAARAADGGCGEDCAAALECGHKCTMKCHSARVPHAMCNVPVAVKCAPRSVHLLVKCALEERSCRFANLSCPPGLLTLFAPHRSQHVQVRRGAARYDQGLPRSAPPALHRHAGRALPGRRAPDVPPVSPSAGTGVHCADRRAVRGGAPGGQAPAAPALLRPGIAVSVLRAGGDRAG